MKPKSSQLFGFVIVTVAETTALCLWLALAMQGKPVVGFLCLIAGEGIEWILLANLIAKSELSHPRRTGTVPRAVAIVGVIAVAEAVLWVAWATLAKDFGITLATLVLFVVMHLKHISEIAIITGRGLLSGVFSFADLCATIAEVGGAAVWYSMHIAGEPVLGTIVLLTCMGVEHYLQFVIGGIFNGTTVQTRHSFLTVAIPIIEARLDAVEKSLDKLGNPAGQAVRNALRGQGIHFLSLTVLRGHAEHNSFLIIEGSLDGPKVSAIDTLATRFGEFLIPVLTVGGNETGSVESLAALMRKHCHLVKQGLLGTPGLNFAGTPGMSVDRIRSEYKLARWVRDILEHEGVPGTPLQVLESLRQRIAGEPDFRDLIRPEPMAQSEPINPEGVSVARLIGRGVWTFLWPLLLLAALLTIALTIGFVGTHGVVLGLIAGIGTLQGVLVCIVLVGYLAYQLLRRKEETDLEHQEVPSLDLMTQIMQRENKCEQNHLAIASTLKPGVLRKLTLRLAFWIIAQIAARSFRPGFLGDIGTIHFARWILLPGTNKLLFFSNYGGSWESYLEDFITRAHAGLTVIWSNTVGFPLTKNLIENGASNGDRFKRWARFQQHPTRFWYSAYPYLSTQRIRINAAIRHGLAVAKTEDQATEWFSCIGSRPRPATTIEANDVQSIVFGGIGRLQYAVCLLIQLPMMAASSRAWLRTIEPGLTFGDGPLGIEARIMGLTHSGLVRLGLNSDTMHEFPICFQQGMAVDYRAQILGDTGDDAPDRWQWGSQGKCVDAAVLIYHHTQEDLDSDSARQRELIESHGGSIIHRVIMKVLDRDGPTREPFGFVDGVSQPIIRGTRSWTADSDPMHVVSPGEFILGYPDNRGQVPVTPTVPASADRLNHLAGISRKSSDIGFPSFDQSASDGPRDLGRNGSFLVIRQLEQDTEAFNEFVSQAAFDLMGRPGTNSNYDQPMMEEWVAAKMIGRWRDGTSLVRFPEHPGNGWPGTDRFKQQKQEPDNSFLIGVEDPLGYRCPFGAHIRRTNPRESANPGSQEQLAITNRHRILRIGRPYDPQSQPGSDSTKPGLLFMCLNADIERQFEFVQQTWAMARLFHGLDGEVDSVLGRGLKGGRLTIPTPQGPILLNGIRDFVRVRGGGYFFLPSHRAVRFLCRPDDSSEPLEDNCATPV